MSWAPTNVAAEETWQFNTSIPPSATQGARLEQIERFIGNTLNSVGGFVASLRGRPIPVLPGARSKADPMAGAQQFSVAQLIPSSLPLFLGLAAVIALIVLGRKAIRSR